MRRTINISEFASKLSLEILCGNKEGSMIIDTSQINRPGLQFSGFFEHFTSKRVQIIGRSEMTYLYTLDQPTLHARLEDYFSHDIPCIIIGRSLKPPDGFIDIAQKHNVPVFSSSMQTGKLSHSVISYIDNFLAPCIAKHGGLMDIHGIGVLIIGESGVGKSETMLELVQRGHRLVADDVVKIRKINDDTLIGAAPDIIRYLMEIRGLGLIDVSVLYGTGAVMIEKQINICVRLEVEGSAPSDRLCKDEKTINILDVNVPLVTIPVKPGRNIAIIIEVAARNYRLSAMGLNAVASLDQKILNMLE